MKTLVKDWKEFIIPITTLKSITGLSIGRVIVKSLAIFPAPSSSAAS